MERLIPNYSTKQTNIPNVFAEIGGGMLSLMEVLRHPKTHNPPAGAFGMEPDDAGDFRSGIEAARLYDDHELALTHETALIIGGSPHQSIAPISYLYGRADPPRKPADDARDFSAWNCFYQAEDLIAGSATNAQSDLFHQLGDEALKNAGISKESSGRSMPDARSSIVIDRLRDFEKLGESVTPYLRHADDAVAVQSPVGNLPAGPSQHRPLTQREEFPSLAPIGTLRHHAGLLQKVAHVHRGEAHDNTTRSAVSRLDVKHMTAQIQVQRTLETLLNAQARLPPAGPTAFDPRLSPAWAGLKLPQ